MGVGSLLGTLPCKTARQSTQFSLTIFWQYLADSILTWCTKASTQSDSEKWAQSEKENVNGTLLKYIHVEIEGISS